MAAVRRIVCATDFSPASGPALDFAQRLALASQAEVTVVHVVPWIPMPLEGAFDPQTYQRLTDEARREAEAALGQLRAELDPGVRAAVRVEDGPAAPRIMAVADTVGADLLVVGTHGRTGLNRLLVGSVAEQLVELARQPVITVRPLPGPTRSLRRPLARIMFPSDFSPASRRAWPWVRALAEASGATVEILHVVRDVVPEHHLDPALLASLSEAIRHDARRAADEFVAGCGLSADRVNLHLQHGVEADQIVHVAQELATDLIVMGTHGRTGILRLALGSVTRRVVHEAPCPVLTVGPHTA